MPPACAAWWRWTGIPTDNSLYALQHGRDDLLMFVAAAVLRWQSAVFPSEEFFRVKDGMHAGWPYCYYDQMQGKKVLNPEYGGDGKLVGKCGEYEKPLIGFPAHWAPNDIFFYQGHASTPEPLQKRGFYCLSWLYQPGALSAVGLFYWLCPFKNGKPAGDWEVFADGFAGVDPIVNVSRCSLSADGYCDGARWLAVHCRNRKG